MTVTEPMKEMLLHIGPKPGREIFAPNGPVKNALVKRGLIRAQFIGMRWWHLSPTSEGQRIIKELQST